MQKMYQFLSRKTQKIIVCLMSSNHQQQLFESPPRIISTLQDLIDNVVNECHGGLALGAASKCSKLHDLICMCVCGKLSFLLIPVWKQYQSLLEPKTWDFQEVHHLLWAVEQHQGQDQVRQGRRFHKAEGRPDDRHDADGLRGQRQHRIVKNKRQGFLDRRVLQPACSFGAERDRGRLRRRSMGAARKRQVAIRGDARGAATCAAPGAA